METLQDLYIYIYVYENIICINLFTIYLQDSRIKFKKLLFTLCILLN